MTAPLMLDEHTLADLVSQIRAWLETARQYVGGLVDQWHQVINYWIGNARKILGDRPKLQATTEVWKQTTKHLTEAIGKLSDAENNDEFWTGAGADGFEDWVTRSKASLQTWTTTIGAAGSMSGAFIGALNKASAGVVEFLNGIFQSLTELLKGLVAAFGQLGGVAKPGTTGVEIDPAAITGAISSVVTGFLTASQTALSTAASTLNIYDTAGNDAEAAGQSMIQIRMPGSGLTDLRGHPVKSER